MGTLAYAAIIFAAVATVEVGSEVVAEISQAYLFDLFDHVIWQPHERMGADAQPLDMLAELMIDD